MDSTHIRMSGTPSLTILSKEQKFNGENLLSWTTNMIQLLGSKGLSGYIDGKIALPVTPLDETPDSTPIYSTTPSNDEWHFRVVFESPVFCGFLAIFGTVEAGAIKKKLCHESRCLKQVIFPVWTSLNQKNYLF